MGSNGLGDAELAALLAAVDASGEDTLRDIDISVDVASVVSLDDASSPSLLDEVVVWWMELDDAVERQNPDSVTLDAPATTYEGALHQNPITVSTQSEITAPSSTYARVVASRRRAKEELAHLRHRVHELEQQLETARAIAMPTSPSPSEVSQDGTVASAVDQFWQRLAQSEREARHRAVAENLQLRSQLEAQLRTARSLEKLLKKRSLDVTESISHDASFKRLRVGADTEDANAIYASLVPDLDVRYRQTDAVFRESGLAGRQETYQDAHVRFADDGSNDAATRTTRSSCVEFVTSHIVPFGYEMTRDVAWRALQSQSIPLHNGVYETVETASDDDSTVKALFTIHTKLRGSDVVSRARFVARQYVEENRVVVVWALASTLQGGVLKGHRIELLEEGWSAISPLATDTGSDTNQLCLTQACGRLRPRMVVRAGSKLDELVGLLTDVFLDCYHDTQQGLYDFTGRMLLDEAARQR